MKIIKKGAIKPKIYIFECDNCGCVFEMNHDDPEDAGGMYERFFEGIIFMRAPCPTCHGQTTGCLKEEIEYGNN